MSKKRRGVRPGAVISAVLVAAAVVKELRTPAEQRTWKGRLGFIPYDLRIPTFERLRRAWFDPDDSRLFTPRPLGVGWAINFGKLVGGR